MIFTYASSTLTPALKFSNLFFVYLNEEIVVGFMVSLFSM